MPSMAAAGVPPPARGVAGAEGDHVASPGKPRLDGPEAGHPLTIELDHSMGTGHSDKVC